MRGYSVKTRRGAKVTRDRFGDLQSALAELRRQGTELQEQADAGPIDLRIGRKFEPVQLVTARIELAGPGRLRVGVDVRGDGSAEAWTGRFRRKLVEQLSGESPYEALQRLLAGR